MKIPGWQIALFVLAMANAYVVAILGVNLHNRCLTKKKGCTTEVSKHTERANVALVVVVTLIVVGAIAFLVFGGAEAGAAEGVGGQFEGFGSFFNPRSARYYYASSIPPLLLSIALLLLTVYNMRAYESCKTVCGRHKNTGHVKRMLEWWGFIAAGFNFIFFAYNLGMGIHKQTRRRRMQRVQYNRTQGYSLLRPAVAHGLAGVSM